jgi:DNA-binding transcriptional MerR regulator
MFQIGEFARIAQVSTAQLRRYDKMGLLTPQKIDSFTGYRYYSATQLPRLNRILALKELGLTLKQIGRALDDNISAEELRGMLYMKKTQIEQLIYEELSRIRYIESRIDEIDADGQLEEYDIVLKSVPAKRFLATRNIYDSVEEARQSIEELNRFLPQTISRKSLGCFTVILYSGIFVDGDIDMQIGFQLEQDIHDDLPSELSSSSRMTIEELPAAKYMLTTTRIGDPQLGHGPYGALGRWMEVNGYDIDGHVRETFIQFESFENIDKMVTEIQYPVKPIVGHNPRLT